MNAHTELRAKRQRSAWEVIYRNRPMCGGPYLRSELAQAALGVSTDAADTQGHTHRPPRVIQTVYLIRSEQGPVK